MILESWSYPLKPSARKILSRNMFKTHSRRSMFCYGQLSLSTTPTFTYTPIPPTSRSLLFGTLPLEHSSLFFGPINYVLSGHLLLPKYWSFLSDNCNHHFLHFDDRHLTAVNLELDSRLSQFFFPKLIYFQALFSQQICKRPEYRHMVLFLQYIMVQRCLMGTTDV